MDASSSQGRVGGRSVQQPRRPTRVERNISIRSLRRYIPYASELPEEARDEPLSVRQNIFATRLLEELGIDVGDRREALRWLSVVVVLDGVSLEVVGVNIRIAENQEMSIYYFSLEEVATWPQRTRMLLLGTEFNRTHFAHVEHHVGDGVEGLTIMGDYNPMESGQEVEQNVQLEQQEAPQEVQLESEVELEQVEVPQDVQLTYEVEQIQDDNDNGGLEVEVEFDNDGDIVMVDVVGEGIDVQELQFGHRYPLRDTRARREYREREQNRRDRVGDENDRGRRVRRRFQ
eukprot:g8398.t1